MVSDSLAKQNVGRIEIISKEGNFDGGGIKVNRNILQSLLRNVEESPAAVEERPSITQKIRVTPVNVPSESRKKKKEQVPPVKEQTAVARRTVPKKKALPTKPIQQDAEDRNYIPPQRVQGMDRLSDSEVEIPSYIRRKDSDESKMEAEIAALDNELSVLMNGQNKNISVPIPVVSGEIEVRNGLDSIIEPLSKPIASSDRRNEDDITRGAGDTSTDALTRLANTIRMEQATKIREVPESIIISGSPTAPRIIQPNNGLHNISSIPPVSDARPVKPPTMGLRRVSITPTSNDGSRPASSRDLGVKSDPPTPEKNIVVASNIPRPPVISGPSAFGSQRFSSPGAGQNRNIERKDEPLSSNRSSSIPASNIPRPRSSERNTGVAIITGSRPAQCSSASSSSTLGSKRNLTRPGSSERRNTGASIITGTRPAQSSTAGCPSYASKHVKGIRSGGMPSHTNNGSYAAANGYSRIHKNPQSQPTETSPHQSPSIHQDHQNDINSNNGAIEHINSPVAATSILPDVSFRVSEFRDHAEDAIRRSENAFLPIESPKSDHHDALSNFTGLNSLRQQFASEMSTNIREKAMQQPVHINNSYGGMINGINTTSNVGNSYGGVANGAVTSNVGNSNSGVMNGMSAAEYVSAAKARIQQELPPRRPPGPLESVRNMSSSQCLENAIAAGKIINHEDGLSGLEQNDNMMRHPNDDDSETGYCPSVASRSTANSSRRSRRKVRIDPINRDDIVIPLYAPVPPQEPKDEKDLPPEKRNEKLIKTKKDKLFYSKKPREVQYEPKKYDDYQKKYVGQIEKQSKSLGPDLENEELQKKKMKSAQIEAYSKKLREMNKEKIENQKKLDPRPKAKELSKRQRAMEFAQSVPKPKVVEKTKFDSDASTIDGYQVDPEEFAAVDAEAELYDRWTKHMEHKRQVENIKKHLENMEI